jgi:hypothetical protein
MDIPVQPPSRNPEAWPPAPGSRHWTAFLPALAAMAYPFWLQAFHAAVGHGLVATLLLLGAFVMPLLAAALWLRSAGVAPRSGFEGRVRRLALLAVAAPPLFVFCAFVLGVLGVLGRPAPEPGVWVAMWSTAGWWAWMGQRKPCVATTVDPTGRVVHGVVAALVLAFIAFHLFNHLLGLLGPQTHAAVMDAGRKVYRLPAVEAMLVVLFLLQLGLGAWLARRWSLQRMDGYRAVQVATGVYLGFFMLTHMNSALVSARTLHGVATDWYWASGAPEGLMQDAWNIRLVPHYALGAFCALAHLACGLRSVLLAHGRQHALVNRAWAAGLVAAAAVSALIVAGLCGLRFAAA